MLTNRLTVLACLIALTAPACGGRSGLDDFAGGADNLLPGTGGGEKVDADGGGGSAGDAGSSGNVTGADDGGTAGGPAGKGEIGAGCQGDKACLGDTSSCLTDVLIGGVLTVNFPNGYCAIEDCQKDSDCPNGAACAPSINACLQRCDDTDSCRADEGYECRVVTGSQKPDTYCLPARGGGGGNMGGNDVTQFCSFICQDPASVAQCMAENDLSFCMGGQGGG